MKVVLAGLGRTGTSSLRLAFEQLGLSTLSQFDLISDPSTLGRVLDMVDGSAPFDPAVVDGADVTLGWPLCWLYAEQLQAWPEARCILNVRDPDGWFDSVSRAMKVLAPMRRMRFAAKLRIMDRMLGTLEARMGCPPDRARWTEGYRRHTEAVRAAVPAERLLVYEIGSGWEPICRFLDLPVPDVDFPRGNSSGNDEFANNVRRILGLR